RHSNSLIPALLHVPLLVKYPNQHAPNVVDEPVASIDIMPTILRALGQGCPTCEGHPLQEAGRASAPPRFAYLMGHNEVKPVIRCVVAEGWKLILADKEGLPREQLFRLDADPTEANDQRAAHPEVATRLAAANARLRASHRRRTLAAAVFFVGSVASTLTACWERLCLTSVSGTMAAAVGRCEQQVHECRKNAARSGVALAALARSHE